MAMWAAFDLRPEATPIAMNKYASQVDVKLIGFCPIEFGPFIAELQLIEEKLAFCQVSRPGVGNSQRLHMTGLSASFCIEW